MADNWFDHDGEIQAAYENALLAPQMPPQTRQETRRCFRNDCNRSFPGMGMYVFTMENGTPKSQRAVIQCLRHPNNMYSVAQFESLKG